MQALSHLKKIILVPVVKFSLLTAILIISLTINYLQAAWTGPTATAPQNNTDAPINTGTATQNKDGTLGVDGLAVFGNGVVDSYAPQIEFSDRNNKDWWIHVNNDRFYLLADRDDNGSYSGEGPWPIQMYAGANSSADWVQFSNQVRAAQFCDQNGDNCFTAADVGGGGGGLDLVNGQHSSDQCTALGGTVVTDNGNSFCQFIESSCPAGWAQFENWSITANNYCSVGYSKCGNPVRSCYTGEHAVFSNIALETCLYGGYDTETGDGCYINNAPAPLVCSATITQIGCY